MALGTPRKHLSRKGHVPLNWRVARTENIWGPGCRNRIPLTGVIGFYMAKQRIKGRRQVAGGRYTGGTWRRQLSVGRWPWTRGGAAGCGVVEIKTGCPISVYAYVQDIIRDVCFQRAGWLLFAIHIFDNFYDYDCEHITMQCVALRVWTISGIKAYCPASLASGTRPTNGSIRTLNRLPKK